MINRGSIRAAATIAVTLALALSATPAEGTPTVTVVGRAVSIPGFPHTGNIYGAGAALRTQIKISGSEYAGAPEPLIGIRAFLPKGVKLNPGAFPTCNPSVIVDEREPRKCPKGAAAGPVGKADGVVSFGGERVPESVEILSFYTPHNGFVFFADGHTPAIIEIGSTGKLVSEQGSGGFGPEFEGEVPLVATVPGAPYASVESIEITLGTAIRKHGRPIYYGTVPKKGQCPKGGFKGKAQFIFAINGEPSRPDVVTLPVTAPCPTH